jgi:hypothetical protein
MQEFNLHRANLLFLFTSILEGFQKLSKMSQSSPYPQFLLGADTRPNEGLRLVRFLGEHHDLP